MGQYSALVAAGVIDLADGLRLVRERGRQMQAVGAATAPWPPSSASTTRGSPSSCAAGQAHGVFGVANRNSPGQVVVSGERAAVEAAAEAAQGLGAQAGHRAARQRRRPLARSWRAAAAGMRRPWPPVTFARSECAAAGQRRRAPADQRRGLPRELVDHLTTGVDWVAAVDAMRAAGVTTFIEVGPGKVLTGLIRRIAPDAATIALDDPGAPQGLAPEALTSDPAAAAVAQPIT